MIIILYSCILFCKSTPIFWFLFKNDRTLREYSVQTYLPATFWPLQSAIGALDIDIDDYLETHHSTNSPKMF